MEYKCDLSGLTFSESGQVIEETERRLTTIVNHMIKERCLAVLEELENEIKNLDLTGGRFQAREDCERGYEISKDEVLALIRAKKEKVK